MAAIKLLNLSELRFLLAWNEVDGIVKGLALFLWETINLINIAGITRDKDRSGAYMYPTKSPATFYPVSFDTQMIT